MCSIRATLVETTDEAEEEALVRSNPAARVEGVTK
jgi:hypothetical protein